MTNLIEKVAELRELATKDIPGKYTSDCPEYDYIVGMLNAAPKLLDVLSRIQTRDAEIFDALIDCLESCHGGTEYEDIELSAMRRYRDLAHLMEDDHAT